MKKKRNENDLNSFESKFRDSLLKILYLNLQKYDSSKLKRDIGERLYFIYSNNRL
jgi:hypothetical protein